MNNDWIDSNDSTSRHSGKSNPSSVARQILYSDYHDDNTSSFERKQEPFPSMNFYDTIHNIRGYNNHEKDLEQKQQDHHDQLPTVEEIKAKVFAENTQSVTENNAKRKRQCVIYVILSTTVSILSLLGLIVVVTKRQHQYNAAVTSITQTVRISKPNVFQDSESPQSRALHWMLYQDPLHLSLPKQHEDAFCQRYIIVTFLFAVANHNVTMLQQTMNILSAQHECMWNSQWKYDDADDSTVTGTTTFGIVCDTIEKNDDHEGMRDRDEDVVDKVIESRSVTGIVMPSLGLQGELPPELETLRHLRRVELDNNQIQGNVPVMPYLHYLNLAYNSLTGYLPDHFSDMERLEILSMAENGLQGSLPKSFAALTNLKLLALNGNELTAGLDRIYALTNLEEIYLSYNSLEDHLSNGSFQALTNLKVLDMKSNRLDGPLPDELWHLPHLKVIDFYHNALDGHINDVIPPHHSLKYLDVSSNILGGGFPPSFSNLRSLTHLDVSYNRFDVLLPHDFSNMTHMKRLLLTENEMFGPQPIPVWIRSMTDLTHLSFRLTARTGTLPTWLGELTNLELLDLDWNHIAGTIPSELGQLTRLKYLMLNRNLMNGKIPSEVSSLPNLTMFMVDNNEFYGELDVCHISFLIADCGNPDLGCPNCDSDTQRIACPCCTGCCDDDDESEQCNMQDWIVQVEDEFRGAYGQYGYTFTPKDYMPLSR